MDRNELQDKAVGLSEEHSSLLLSWPTGTGKGRAVMKCILASKSPKKWLVVVPELVQIENWHRDAEKHGLREALEAKVEEVICYASLEKWSESAFNLALNEAHRVSEERAKVVFSINYDQLLMDTATLPKEVRERLPLFHEYKVTMKEAVDWGIIPPPEMNIHYLDLDDWNKKWPKKMRNGQFVNVCGEEYYKYLTSNFKYWQARAHVGEPWEQKRMFLAAITRKRWIAEYKTTKAKEIIQLIKDKRFIVFCGSVKQAKELGGKQAVHSGNKKSQQLIDEFNEYTTNSLYACSMMREGMNLEGIEAGLITQLDAKDLGNIQRLGRILRSEYPELHLICVRGTKDEDYLRDFLKVTK